MAAMYVKLSLQFGFKDGGGVIVPVYLEFTVCNSHLGNCKFKLLSLDVFQTFSVSLNGKWLVSDCLVTFAILHVDLNNFFKHLNNFHSNEPNFQVYCSRCPLSFTKVNSLQKHFSRCHKHEIQIEDDEVENFYEPFCLPDISQEDGLIDVELKEWSVLSHHVAKFLLCAKEKGKIPQTALDMVTESAQNLFGEYMEIVKKAIVAKMTDTNNEHFELPEDIEELFEADKIFEDLSTEYQQRSYYINNFKLVVSM